MAFNRPAWLKEKRESGKPPVNKDLTGLRFGKIEVLNYVDKDKHGKSYWRIRCDCGNIDTVVGHYLTTGRWIQCSECIKKSCYLEGRKNPKFKGVGDLSRTFWSSIVGSAAHRKINIEISMEDAWFKFLDQDKKCALSGIDLFMSSSIRQFRKGITKHTASLDRIDSSKGYTKDNIQWVHVDINFMKQEMDQDYFIKICKRIASQHKDEFDV